MVKGDKFLDDIEYLIKEYETVTESVIKEQEKIIKQQQEQIKMLMKQVEKQKEMIRKFLSSMAMVTTVT